MKSGEIELGVGTCAIACSLLLTHTSVLAQGAPGAAPEEGVLENIVVTAQRREENLIDVPIAVSAFDNAGLERRRPGFNAQNPLLAPFGGLVPLSGIDASLQGFRGGNIMALSDRSIGYDQSDQDADQFSQEIRIASNFDGKWNFQLGALYFDSDDEENYFVATTELDYASLLFQALSVPGAPPFPGAPPISSTEPRRHRWSPPHCSVSSTIRRRTLSSSQCAG